MIKAIIFDCFGVLVNESLETFYKKYFKNDQDLIEKAEFCMHQANKGLITHEELVGQFAELGGISAQETRAALAYNPVNVELFKYIEHELKLKYKLGFLSNASDDWLNELFTSNQLGLFDAFVLSYQTGYAKPEPQIYSIMADRLNVRLDECIFFDDRQDYVEGAQGVGMLSARYVTFEKFTQDLKELL